jgi:tetratricopeptide (TPR) repeat protein
VASEGAGWKAVALDEIEAVPWRDTDLVWRPVRGALGTRIVGMGGYTADRAGQVVIEGHTESDDGLNHEEVYVVLRGRATFTLDGDEVDAPAGTIVYAQPNTRRGAVAAEDGTAVLAVGAKPGVVFEPSLWEEIFAANAYADKGELDKGRKLIADLLAEHPDSWQGYYNAACLEARAGDKEQAFGHLERAVSLEPEKVREFAANDSDFDSIRDDPRFSAVAGQADSAG